MTKVKKVTELQNKMLTLVYNRIDELNDIKSELITIDISVDNDEKWSYVLNELQDCNSMLRLIRKAK